MKVGEFIGKSGFEVATPAGNPEAELAGAYTSDLLSDAMAHCPPDSVLITVQNHRNTVAVCTLAGAPVIVVCHGREIPADMAEAAAKEKVAILKTDGGQFETSLKVAKILGL